MRGLLRYQQMVIKKSLQVQEVECCSWARDAIWLSVCLMDLFSFVRLHSIFYLSFPLVSRAFLCIERLLILTTA
jgi:hypothetical protein